MPLGNGWGHAAANGRSATFGAAVVEELQGVYTPRKLTAVLLLDPTIPGSPAANYRERLTTPASRQTVDKAFRTLSRCLNGSLGYAEGLRLRADLLEKYAPATVNKLLACLRGTLKEAFRLELVSADQLLRWQDALAGVSHEPAPAGRRLSAAELQALFRVCADDLTRAGARDAAILAVLYGCGLRRAELCGLEARDFDGKALQVLGKGRRSRRAACPDGTLRALDEWMAIRGDDQGVLFCAINRGDRLGTHRAGDGRKVLQGMSGQAVMFRLRKRAEQARIERFSPHDLRRTFLSDLLDQGVDLLVVQRMAGHSQPQTTSRYDRRGEESQQEAARGVLVPFVESPRGHRCW